MSYYHRLSYHYGRDRRMPGDYDLRNRGIFRWGDMLCPFDEQAMGGWPVNDFLGDPGATYLAQANIRPYCVTSTWYAADGLGNPYPDGTLFVASYAGIIGQSPLRLPGETWTTVTNGSFSVGPQSQDLIYRATGIPPGASCTYSITAVDGGALLTTITIDGANGPGQTIQVPTFTGPANGGGALINGTWSGGIPVQENTSISIQSQVTYFAVPSVLPSGYTPRYVDDMNRGGSFGATIHGDRRRYRGGPNTSYEMYGLSVGGGITSDAAYGCPVGAGQNIWVGGSLWAYSWPPIANGQDYFMDTGTYVAVIGSTGGGVITTAGIRPGTASLAITYQQNSSPPQPTDDITVTVLQDGNTIFTQSATGAAIMSMSGGPVLVTLPAAGVTTTFTVVWNGISGGMPAAWSIKAVLTGSYRCDIPLPYTCGGPGGIVAPGGYIPALLSAPVNRVPLMRLSPGVSSYAFSSACAVAFTPSADGWWQVLGGGIPQIGIGEDPFGWADGRLTMPGRAGRSFYCIPQNSPVVLTPFSPPVPMAVPASGALLNLFTSGGWAWASCTFGAAGRYMVSLAIQSGTPSGLTLGYSLMDPQVLNPTQAAAWEPYDESYPDEYGGPPVPTGTPPTNAAASGIYIVAPGGTGAWLGRDNLMAYFDTAWGQWIFRAPRANSMMGDGIWYDGQKWHFNFTDPQIQFSLVTTVPGQTVYFLLGLFCTDGGTSSTVQMSWTGPA